jgi:hypothetical protein
MARSHPGGLNVTVKLHVIYLTAILLLAGLSAFLLIRQGRISAAWEEGYYLHIASAAQSELEIAEKVREGRTNNFLPPLETLMLMHASDIARERAIEKYASLQEHTNLLNAVRDYALKHNLFEDYKGLPSHEYARRSLLNETRASSKSTNQVKE